MSNSPSLATQIAHIHDNKIVAQGSVTISATINIHHKNTLFPTRTVSNREENGSPELVAVAMNLAQTTKELVSMLLEAMDLPAEFVVLKDTLDRLLEVTIPRTIEFASRGQIDLNVKLKRELDRMLALVEVFLQTVGMEQLRSKQSSILSLLWGQIWWLFSGRWDVRKFNEALEKLRYRVQDLLLHESLAASPNNCVIDPQVAIEDFFGARWFLPLYQCLDRDMFSMALQVRFKGGSAENIIAAGRFHVLSGGGLEIITKSNWKNAIELEPSIQLSVIYQVTLDHDEEKYTLVRCPRCKYAQRTASNNRTGWVDCYQCESRFSLSEIDSEEPLQDLDSTRASQLDASEYNLNYGAPFKYYSITTTTAIDNIGKYEPLLSAHMAISPILGKSKKYTIEFDLSLSPQVQHLDPQVLGEAATYPPIPAMMVTCGLLPWVIHVLSTGTSKQGPYVTIKDVFDQMYSALRTPVSEEEYKEVKTLAELRAIDASYFRRWERIVDPAAREIERSKGVKRIDFLKGLNKFRGLTLADRNVVEHWQLLVF